MKLRFCYILIMVVSLFATNANGAPWAYSINSDSVESTTWDSLYKIDLATVGLDQLRGPLSSATFQPLDTEGLAVDRDGNLWGIDDGSTTPVPRLFPIDTTIVRVNFSETFATGLLPGGKNDFGMTFACDNSLYVTSVSQHKLYRLELDGTTVEIGNLKNDQGIDVNISAIAAIGNPTRLYGLENGDEVSPNLYSIDVDSGLATEIGPLGVSSSGPVYEYTEGGLSFDSAGNLWAITDRSFHDELPSQILSINVNNGAASHVRYTGEIGFESLAIAPPTDCDVKASRDGEEDPRIPTLGPGGLLLAVFALMFSGMAILRRRIS